MLCVVFLEGLVEDPRFLFLSLTDVVPATLRARKRTAQLQRAGPPYVF